MTMHAHVKNLTVDITNTRLKLICQSFDFAIEAFSGIGIDYFGPVHCRSVYIDDGSEEETHKLYGALYTCATTHSVIREIYSFLLGNYGAKCQKSIVYKKRVNVL